MSSYVPKNKMPEGFSIQENPLTSEQHDKLVDAYPWAYGPNQEYFKELRKKEEEEERRKFLEKVSPTSTSIPALSKKAKTIKPSHFSQSSNTSSITRNCSFKRN